MLLLIIRFIFLIIWAGIVTIVGILISLVRPFNPQNATIACQLFKWGHLILGLKLVVENREQMNKSTPCIFVSNHQSNIDIFVGAFSSPPRTVSMGKRSLLWIPLFGLFYWLSGNILINRKNKKSAHSTMDEAAKIISEKKLSVWIMPEGTRSRGRGLLPFKKGAFLTAIKAKIPIVPVVVSSYYGKINFKKWNSGIIYIRALPPIETAHFNVTETEQLKNKVHRLIEENLLLLNEDHQV